MKTTFLLSMLLLGSLVSSCAEAETAVKSPDGRIALTFTADSTGAIFYAVDFDGSPLIETSPMGLEAADGIELSGGFRVKDTKFARMDETWVQPWGENKTVLNRCNEMAVELENHRGVGLTVRFRVFDDGVGFRYEYGVPSVDSVFVSGERTRFGFAADGDSWTIPASAETYELLYRKLPLSGVETANTPATFRTRGGVYVSIHEAALTDFPEMTLTKAGPAVFSSELASWPDGVKARMGGSFNTPWRTIQISDRAVGLINSSLILNLNEPCALETTDWIRPVKYVGVWWGMHLGVESWVMGDRHGATTANAMKYIDFAANNNIQAVLFEGWNAGWENWGGSQRFDYTRPYADFDIDKIADYARSRGISVMGHHETGGNVPVYESRMEEAIGWYSDKGVHMLKTGYAGGFPGGHSHHGQYAVRHYRRVVETAAEHKMTLNVHEPVKATGIRRNYPNMMTREGARGMEWNAWSEGNPPEHHVMLPFTRLLSGPMDYTPGTFDILFENTRHSPDRRRWNDNDKGNSRVNTTLAKQIALWVVLYSPMQMASDLIEHYRGHPAFGFFRDFDADCDWSEALAGEPGEYVAVVRRAGDRYFLGAITDQNPREIDIPLDFLDGGRSYEATIYGDAPDAHWQTNPTAYAIDRRTISAADTLSIRMAPGGGAAVTFIPTEE